MAKKSLLRETDDTARALAQDLLNTARFAALGTLQDGVPMVTRIAFARAPDGMPLSLISDLSAHAAGLRAAPEASLLIGEPGPKGDPLTHPRLTLQARATFVSDKTALRDQYLALHPKAQLYIDFGDFHFVRFTPIEAYLNGGFGKAYHLTPEDLQCAG